ncbi:MAG: LamG-like jellyroll fold domain-containing protein, partial [Saprospiraceae bacterium]
MLVGLCYFNLFLFGQAGQLLVPRIELMPDQPNPYNLRNWKQVARQYDSMVYDVTKTGTYLPLLSIGNSGINYPENKTIKMHTYVGTNSPNGSEAINVLPSLVGASLVGIDKRNQFGQNWLIMSWDFFNKANGENIYLNNAGAGSGGDWWYDLMPNLFFYQLYDLYPNLGNEADVQFNTIAGRFLEAVRAMGGRDTPWNIPNMNYRAWKFKTMQPNASGVKEPEAAGVYAWVLYHAWIKTGNAEYLKGAEWAIEFLDQYSSNPSYELQLPYGTYLAAKMNAELGTTYNIPKMVNWSFDRGALRGWGTIVGKWGGFDVSGLVGEANDGGNDYAFQLNGVQQAAALVPMVRYDKRFARSIAKWVLNLANATRLYYPGFLPNNLQDASTWSNANDPKQVIGYEALREKNNGLSPFSTGDALKGGWAATNLAVYGTSSIGYLGSIIEETAVEKILKLDVLKTDFFNGPSYPTYLLYNPYPSSKEIKLDAGISTSNIYEALTEKFIAQNISGQVNITIPANQAILISITPANGVIRYDHQRMLINDVVVDYRQTNQIYTRPVRIKALAADKKTIQTGDSTKVFATAVDPDGGTIEYKWSNTIGSIHGTGNTINWIAPNEIGPVILQVIVSDVESNRDTATLELNVVSEINLPPTISTIQKSAAYVSPGGSVQLTGLATDPNKDTLTYQWTSTGGIFNTTNVKAVSWSAPSTEGIYTLTLLVKDRGNLSAQAATTILVKNFSNTTGHLIAYYPFTGNTEDASGNLLHGQGLGIVLVPDRNGSPNAAYYFNGGTQHVIVPNNPILNFQNSITVSCWFNAARLPDKETFLLSHGSWQNRWKISFTPEKYLRWTVNTSNAIGDLDTPFPFGIDSFYYVTAGFDGSIMTLYVNGQLVTYKTLTGNIRATTLPFLMGQMLVDDATYNFKGVIDEVKIFDYALSPP